jgi:hypothetical protein
MERSADKQSRWVFLSNHAHVLLCIARDPDIRYEINRHGHLGTAAFRDLEIGPLLDVLNTADGARSTQTANSPPVAHGASSIDQASPTSRRTRRTATTRDIAEQVGITERAAQRLVSGLVAEGYLKRTKVGRRNR